MNLELSFLKKIIHGVVKTIKMKKKKKKKNSVKRVYNWHKTNKKNHTFIYYYYNQK